MDFVDRFDLGASPFSAHVTGMRWYLKTVAKEFFESAGGGEIDGAVGKPASALDVNKVSASQLLEVIRDRCRRYADTLRQLAGIAAVLAVVALASLGIALDRLLADLLKHTKPLVGAERRKGSCHPLDFGGFQRIILR